MPMAAWAAAEWAGWICKRDGRPQRVQATLNMPSLCRELDWRRVLSRLQRDQRAKTPTSRKAELSGLSVFMSKLPSL
jgi:hypothetical protein